MDKIISNSTPLIYLAKASQLELLGRVINCVIIPQAVYREVVVEGKQLEEKDAYRVESAIESGWITVNNVTTPYQIQIPIHRGESEVISLAKEIGIKNVLMDDAKARAAAELAGLQPVGTLWVLLKALKEYKIDFDGFLTTLEDLIRSGFYLKDEVYIKVVRVAKELSL